MLWGQGRGEGHACAHRGEHHVYLRAVTGGTGACWNIEVEENGEVLHICNLDEFIEALTVLRDSEANKQEHSSLGVAHDTCYVRLNDRGGTR